MAIIMAASEGDLSVGMHINEIFNHAHEREPRIQKGNLRTILERLDNLQIDADGRGLVITYDRNKDCISVVDKQLFLYRKYATVKWPWDDLIEMADEGEAAYDRDESAP